ncbi:uncharacterized protein K452DRAFT_297192 [Aplosporella prunicola CBS 121167]|uniref:Carboxymuconolactone decarboxylase-like domain-containing protein n=1 Tax=Aplosporella prunicola CBS 121167 TaxID=1176127 RepID=A0A6A6BKS2_9PEZI|nr:uncharacterized protein K452DRAFT_297192 [Aplosporella prunicola CBS 121167]KAF2143457.1 hypothetical protein K452DRAFT_297192 [Aplosporella prunicola CBS 121167]
MRRAPLAAAAATTSASASSAISITRLRLPRSGISFLASSSCVLRRSLHIYFQQRHQRGIFTNALNPNLNHHNHHHQNKRAMSTTNNSSQAHPGPTPEALPALLAKLQSRLPSSLPRSAHYLVPAATLLALRQPALVGGVFSAFAGQQQGTSGTDSSSSTTTTSGLTSLAIEPTTLSLHLRDLLLKAWTLTGIPLVIGAAASLAVAETASGHAFPAAHAQLSARYGGPPPSSSPSASNPSQAQNPSTQPQPPTPLPLDLAPHAPIPARGATHLQNLYRAQLGPILSTLGAAAADITWLEEAVIYGLFLSDDAVLSRVETSLVVLCAIMGQDLKAPALWHVRGLRRLGVSKDDVEALVRCVEEVAVWVDGGGGGWVGWVGEVEGDLVGDEAWEAEGRGEGGQKA